MVKHNIPGRHVLSAALTTMVVLIVFLSGPAQAITLGINMLESTVDEGEDITFQAQADLHSTDIIPEDVNLTVRITDGTTNYTCTFDLDATELTACADFTISIHSQSLGTYNAENSSLYGYGYSAGNYLTAQTNFSAPGYGFFAGYGYDAYNTNLIATAELIYNITWTTPSVSADTDYYVTFESHFADGINGFTYYTLTANEGTFTVENVGGGGGGGGSSSGGSGGSIVIPTTVPIVTPPVIPRVILTNSDVALLEKFGDLVNIFLDKIFTIDQQMDIIFGTGSPHHGETHGVRLRSIHYSPSSAERYVTVEVNSEPQNVTVYEGQSVTVDFEQDKVYDLLVSVTDITQTTAQISVRELSTRAGEGLANGKTPAQIVAEPQPTEEVEEDITGDVTIGQTPVDEEKNGLSGPLIFVISIVILFAILAIFLLFIRKPKNESKHEFKFEEFKK